MDIKLAYIEKGQGEPLIFLHGNGEKKEYFKKQIEYFSNYYHVYALDSRGHGESPLGTKPFTLKQFSEDLFDFMTIMSIEKAHILGYSDGANVAMYFAKKYVDKVDKLILYSGNISTTGVKRIFQFPIEVMDKAYDVLKKINPAHEKKSRLYKLMTQNYNMNFNDLEKIEAETLVVAGTYDMIRADHTRQIKAAISNSFLAFVKGGHNVSYTNPKDFNKVIKAFLENEA